MYQENLHAPASQEHTFIPLRAAEHVSSVPFLYCSKSIIINSIHTKSRYNSHPIREVLQEQAKKLRKAVYETIEEKK